MPSVQATTPAIAWPLGLLNINNQIHRGITGFRKGFDGLSGIVRNEPDRDPASGEVFVFINRGRNRIKLLQWQDGGFVYLSTSY